MRALSSLLVIATTTTGLLVGASTLAAAPAPVRPPVIAKKFQASAAAFQGVFGNLVAKRSARGVTVTASLSLGVTGLGLFCGNCENPTDQQVFGPVGGRLYSVVQRAATCAAEPPAPDGRLRAASVVSRVTGRPAGRDLSAGGWGIKAVFPAGTLARGTWHLCSWFRVDPSYRVSNPAAPNGMAPGLPAPDLWPSPQGPYRSPDVAKVP